MMANMTGARFRYAAALPPDRARPHSSKQAPVMVRELRQQSGRRRALDRLRPATFARKDTMHSAEAGVQSVEIVEVACVDDVAAQSGGRHNHRVEHSRGR